MSSVQKPPVPPRAKTGFEKSEPLPIMLMISLLRVGALLDKELTDYLSHHAPLGKPTGPQIGILRVLHYYREQGQDGVALSEIGEHLAVSKANMTGMVDRLERDGLVVREMDAKDRRIKRVRLTPHALEVHKRIKPAIIAHIGGLMNTLTQTEQDALLVSLGKLRQALGDMRLM